MFIPFCFTIDVCDLFKERSDTFSANHKQQFCCGETIGLFVSYVADYVIHENEWGEIETKMFVSFSSHVKIQGYRALFQLQSSFPFQEFAKETNNA